MRFCYRLVYVALLSLLCAQWAGAEDEMTAREAVDRWLLDMDKAAYKTSWKQAAPAFQKAVSFDAWMDAAAKVRGPLGRLGARELLSAVYADQLPGAPPGDYVVFQFKTDFEQREDVIETVTPVL